MSGCHARTARVLAALPPVTRRGRSCLNRRRRAGKVEAGTLSRHRAGFRTPAYRHASRPPDAASALPAPVRTAGPGLLHPAQPRADGIDAHRAGGQGGRLPQARRLLRRARGRRRRPDRHRRLLAEPGRLAQAVRRHPALALGSRQAPPGHPCGARARRPHLPADPACRPLRLPSAAGRALAGEGADQPVHPARAVGARRRTADRRVRAHGQARPRRRLRRRRGDGLGRLPAEPVHRAAHQQARRCLGRRRRPAHAFRGRDRAPAPRGLRAGLHHRLPAVAARPGRQRPGLGRGRAAGAGDRGGRRHPHQHRHRLAPRCRAPRSPASPRD